jgi:hypothetical protein
MQDIAKLAETYKECPHCRGPFKPVLEATQGYNTFGIGTDRVRCYAVNVSHKLSCGVCKNVIYSEFRMFTKEEREERAAVAARSIPTETTPPST